MDSQISKLIQVGNESTKKLLNLSNVYGTQYNESLGLKFLDHKLKTDPLCSHFKKKVLYVLLNN